MSRELGAQLATLSAYGRIGTDRAHLVSLELMYPELGSWMGSALDLPLAQQFRFETRTDMEIRSAQPHQLDQMRDLLMGAGIAACRAPRIRGALLTSHAHQ